MTRADEFPGLRRVKSEIYTLLNLLRIGTAEAVQSNIYLFTHHFRRNRHETAQLYLFLVEVLKRASTASLPTETVPLSSVHMEFFLGKGVRRPDWKTDWIYIMLDPTELEGTPDHRDDLALETWFTFHLGTVEPIQLKPHQVLIVFWSDTPPRRKLPW